MWLSSHGLKNHYTLETRVEQSVLVKIWHNIKRDPICMHLSENKSRISFRIWTEVKNPKVRPHTVMRCVLYLEQNHTCVIEPNCIVFEEKCSEQIEHRVKWNQHFNQRTVVYLFNSLWPSDPIWKYSSESTLRDGTKPLPKLIFVINCVVCMKSNFARSAQELNP